MTAADCVRAGECRHRAASHSAAAGGGRRQARHQPGLTTADTGDYLADLVMKLSCPQLPLSPVVAINYLQLTAIAGLFSLAGRSAGQRNSVPTTASSTSTCAWDAAAAPPCACRRARSSTNSPRPALRRCWPPARSTHVAERRRPEVFDPRNRSFHPLFALTTAAAPSTAAPASSSTFSLTSTPQF